MNNTLNSFVKIINNFEGDFNTLMLFRCTTLNFAEEFLKTGNVRFATPKEWIDVFKKEGNGRGDLTEGTYAGLLKYNEETINLYKTMRNKPIINKLRNGFVYLQSEDVLNLRTLCLFGLHNNMFNNHSVAENHTMYPTGKITKEYFGDFAKYVTKENYDSLSPGEKPVLLMINNPQLFFLRVKEFFKNFGLYDNEYIIHPVSYRNRYENFVIGDGEPAELFLKDTTFEHQSEVRIVINTKRNEIIHKLNLCDGIVNLGKMSDIATIYEYYFEDFNMQLRGNSIVFNLPNPKTEDISDPMQIIAYIILALRDELPQCNTLRDTKKFIHDASKMLTKQFGFVCNVKELRFYDPKTKMTYTPPFDRICDCLNSFAYKHYNYGDYKKAIELYSRAISMNSESASSWYGRGCCYFRLRKYKLMLSDFDKAIELDPENSKYINERNSIVKKYNLI